MAKSPKEYALITGATSGIGRALATTFARMGHPLILVARNEKKLNKLAQQMYESFKVKVQFFDIDLTDPKGMNKLYHNIENHDLKVKYLINNAGEGVFGLFRESDFARYRSVVELNIQALTRLCHLFLPHMEENGGGYILNVGSMAGFMPGPYVAVYAATKAYVHSLTLALSSEMKGSNISVSLLAPADVKTKFFKTAGIPFYPGRKALTAEEVAEFAYKKMLRKKRVIIPRRTMRVLKWLSGFSSQKNLSDRIFRSRQKRLNALSPKIAKD